MNSIVNFRALLEEIKEPYVFIMALLCFSLFLYLMIKRNFRLKVLLIGYLSTQCALIALYAVLTNNYDVRKVKSLTELVILENEFIGGYFKGSKIAAIFNSEYLQNKIVYISDKRFIHEQDFKYSKLNNFIETELMTTALSAKQVNWLMQQRGYIEYFGYGFAIPFSQYEKEQEIYFIKSENIQFFLLKSDYQRLLDDC